MTATRSQAGDSRVGPRVTDGELLAILEREDTLATREIAALVGRNPSTTFNRLMLIYGLDGTIGMHRGPSPASCVWWTEESEELEDDA